MARANFFEILHGLDLKALEGALKKCTVLITILVIISVIVEVAHPEIAEGYRWLIELIDAAFVGVIAFELLIRYFRINNRKLFLKKHWLDLVFIAMFFGALRFIKNLRLIGNSSLIPGEKVKIISMNELGLMDSPFVVGKIGKLGFHTMHMKKIKPISRVPRLLKARKFVEGKEEELMALREKILS